MNVKNRLNKFFEELISATEEGIEAIKGDTCESKSVYIDVTVGYETSELGRREQKIEVWMGQEELEEYKEAITKLLIGIGTNL